MRKKASTKKGVFIERRSYLRFNGKSMAIRVKKKRALVRRNKNPQFQAARVLERSPIPGDPQPYYGYRDMAPETLEQSRAASRTRPDIYGSEEGR